MKPPYRAVLWNHPGVFQSLYVCWHVYNVSWSPNIIQFPCPWVYMFVTVCVYSYVTIPFSMCAFSYVCVSVPLWAPIILWMCACMLGCLFPLISPDHLMHVCDFVSPDVTQFFCACVWIHVCMYTIASVIPGVSQSLHAHVHMHVKASVFHGVS